MQWLLTNKAMNSSVCACVCMCVCRTISETLSSLLPRECFSIQPEALSTLFNLTMKLDTKAGTRERWTLCRPCANSLQCRIYFKNEKNPIIYLPVLNIVKKGKEKRA